MTIRSADTGHFHAVRFYADKASLCRMVADFLTEGFTNNQPGLVIATAAHRNGILDELRRRDLDVDALQASNELLVTDAADMLATFMVDGMPDTELFKANVPQGIERLCVDRPGCTVRAYGEMVDVLWKDGLTAAAIRLEVLWNQLAMTQDFSLLCGYAMGNFYKDANLRDICDLHSHVLTTDGPSEQPEPRVN